MQEKQIHSFQFLVFEIAFVFVQCKCVRSLQYVHIIRFEFVRTVFSQSEQTGALQSLMFAADSFRYLLLAISDEWLICLNNRKWGMIFSTFFYVYADVADASFLSTVALIKIALPCISEVFFTI